MMHPEATIVAVQGGYVVTVTIRKDTSTKPHTATFFTAHLTDAYTYLRDYFLNGVSPHLHYSDQSPGEAVDTALTRGSFTRVLSEERWEDLPDS